eukprot:scaffold3289_cov163-Amphora_coffeaeformis.AAC.2
MTVKQQNPDTTVQTLAIDSGLEEGFSSAAPLPFSIHEEDERWKESPFAIGPTKLTWADDDIGCHKICAACFGGSRREIPHMYCSACLCSKLGAGRVGNVIVLWQSSEQVESSGTGEKYERARLSLVAGPYWMVTVLVTLPLIVLPSLLTYYRGLPGRDTWVWIVWYVSTGALLYSLFKVSTTDPGILYRHASPPVRNGDSNDANEEWIWNDQAYTFRPKTAKFDPEIQAVVSHHDHTCPWTGTAIGGGNIFWFKSFLLFVTTTLFLDAALMTRAS